MSYNLVIKIENNNPVGYPMLLDNFLQCNPEVILPNLPNDYAFFERVVRPEISVFELFEDPEVTIEWVGDVVKDVWHVRSMTDTEKQEFITNALSEEHPNGWVFDETLCHYVPPFPRPNDGNRYFWNDETANWAIVVE
jgi:hypothetical protein